MKIARKKLNLIIESFLKEAILAEDITGKSRLIRDIRVYNDRVEIYVNIDKPDDKVIMSSLNQVQPDLSGEIEQRYEFELIATPAVGVAQERLMTMTGIIWPAAVLDWAVPNDSGEISRESIDANFDEGKSAKREVTIDGVKWKWDPRGLKSTNEVDKGYVSFAASFNPGKVNYMDLAVWDNIVQYRNKAAIISSNFLKTEFDRRWAQMDKENPTGDLLTKSTYTKILENLDVPSKLINIFLSNYDDTAYDTSSTDAYPDDFFVQIKGNFPPPGMENARARSESDPAIIKITYESILQKLKDLHASPPLPGRSTGYLDSILSESSHVFSIMPKNKSYALEIDFDPDLFQDDTRDLVKETIFSIFSTHTISANSKVVSPMRLPDNTLVSQITINIEVKEKFQS